MSIIGFTDAEISELTKRVEEWLTANTSKIEKEMDKNPYSLYSCIATADTIRMSLDEPMDEVNLDMIKEFNSLLIYQLIVLQEAVNTKQNLKRKKGEDLHE